MGPILKGNPIVNWRHVVAGILDFPSLENAVRAAYSICAGSEGHFLVRTMTGAGRAIAIARRT